MSTISFKFGVHTRNWPRNDFQPLDLYFEFYFWRFRGAAFCRVSAKSQIVSSKPVQDHKRIIQNKNTRPRSPSVMKGGRMHQAFRFFPRPSVLNSRRYVVSKLM